MPVCRSKCSRAVNGKYSGAAAAMDALRGTLQEEHLLVVQVRVWHHL